MKLSQFKFKLPEELIAKYPVEQRDEARLLVVDRRTGEITPASSARCSTTSTTAT